MASGKFRPMGGENMILEKNCYLCKNLIFFGSSIKGDYYCVITNQKYVKGSPKFECPCFNQEFED